MKKNITKKEFLKELRKYEKGSTTRREFLGRTGLGLATAVFSAYGLSSFWF